jgi:hypothetical protein
VRSVLGTEFVVLEIGASGESVRLDEWHRRCLGTSAVAVASRGIPASLREHFGAACAAAPSRGSAVRVCSLSEPGNDLGIADCFGDVRAATPALQAPLESFDGRGNHDRADTGRVNVDSCG